MRIDHIDNFNIACASVARLAAEAIAEHRRQIEQIESLGREAAALAAKFVAPRRSVEQRKLNEPFAAPERKRGAGQLFAATRTPEKADLAGAVSGTLPPRPGADEPPRQSSSEEAEDILVTAMRRAERDELLSLETASFDESADDRSSPFAVGAAGEETAAPGSHEKDEAPTADNVVLARGRELVASFSGKKRARRHAMR